MKKRFSKDTMLTHIAQKMQALETKWSFDPDNGYQQVIHSDFQRVLAYGEYMALDHLYDEILYNIVGAK